MSDVALADIAGNPTHTPNEPAPRQQQWKVGDKCYTIGSSGIIDYCEILRPCFDTDHVPEAAIRREWVVCRSQEIHDVFDTLYEAEVDETCMFPTLWGAMKAAVSRELEAHSNFLLRLSESVAKLKIRGEG